VTRYIEYDPRQSWKTYGVSDGSWIGKVYSLAIDYYGDAWVGTNGGAYQFVETPGSTTHRRGLAQTMVSTGLSRNPEVTAVAVEHQ